MAASVTRLRTRPDKLRDEEAAQLRQYVLSLEGAPPDAISRVLAAIDKEVSSRNGWTFVMLSPEQNRAVVGWLREHSKRPMVAMLLWSELFVHLRGDTGEIAATQDELALAVGAHPDDVRKVLRELVTIGAVTSWREKVPGLRGPGVSRYSMNPHVATKLPGKARDAAQAAHPPLRLVQPA
jgi:hypothetical protein